MNTQKKRMRLAFLGMWHAHAHGMARQVAAHPDEFELLGGWDPSPEVLTDRAEQWRPMLGSFETFSGPREVLSAPLDGVLVEGQVYDNIALARQALEAGFPVLLEKPLGTDVAGAEALQQLAQERGLHLQMAYLFRYMSAVRALVEEVRAGHLGDIYHFRARLPKDLPTYDFFADQLKPYPGGVFFEMAGHAIDIMVRLLGRPKRVQSFLAHHHSSGPQAYVDDALAVFEFERAWGTVEVPALEVVPGGRRFEVYGTTGGCVIPNLGSGHLANEPVQVLEICRDGTWEKSELPSATLQITDLREFAACVRGEKAADYGMEHDAIVHRALVEASGML